MQQCDPLVRAWHVPPSLSSLAVVFKEQTEAFKGRLARLEASFQLLIIFTVYARRVQGESLRMKFRSKRIAMGLTRFEEGGYWLS